MHAAVTEAQPPRTERRPLTGPRSGPARYVRDLIRSAIVAEAYPEGRVPTEAELMRTYGVTRRVVREALDLLRDEGLIERARRVGTSAVSVKPVYRLRSAQDLAEQGVAPERLTCEVLTVRTVPAAPEVAGALGCATGAHVTLLDRLIRCDDQPLTLSTHYLRGDATDTLLAADDGASFYELVEDELELPIDRIEMGIEAVAADADVAEVLGVPLGSPVLLFQRLVLDADGTPVAFGFNRVRGDRMSLMVNLRRAARPGASS